MRPVVNPITEEFYAALGPWKDADGESTGWALLKFCEAVGQTLQPLIDVIRDGDDGTPGWATIMNPDTAPANYLPWLGQFVGVEVDAHQSIDAQREQVKNEQGESRGTKSYLVKQAQRYLTGTKTVLVYERDTSPYHLTVEFFTGEAAGTHYSDVDTTYGTYAALDAAFPTYHDWQFSTQPILDALAAAKPAGLVMNIIAVPGHPVSYSASQWYVWSSILSSDPAIEEYPLTSTAALVDFINSEF